MMLPVGTSFQIRTAKDPRVDAWRGASSWSRSDEVKSAWISKKAYEEYGSEYMVRSEIILMTYGISLKILLIPTSRSEFLLQY